MRLRCAQHEHGGEDREAEDEHAAERARATTGDQLGLRQRRGRERVVELIELTNQREIELGIFAADLGVERREGDAFERRAYHRSGVACRLRRDVGTCTLDALDAERARFAEETESFCRRAGHPQSLGGFTLLTGDREIAMEGAADVGGQLLRARLGVAKEEELAHRFEGPKRLGRLPFRVALGRGRGHRRTIGKPGRTGKSPVRRSRTSASGPAGAQVLDAFGRRLQRVGRRRGDARGRLVGSGCQIERDA